MSVQLQIMHYNGSAPTLEKYKGSRTRFECPQCGKPGSFTRYVDDAGQHIAPHVGKCNRLEKCGYHYTPKQYRADNPSAEKSDWKASDAHKTVYVPPPPREAQILPEWLFTETLSGPPCNFVRYLAARFGREAAQDLRRRFSIGTNADLWPGSTVFWIVDAQGRPAAAQVINYDPETGKTVKYIAQDGGKRRRANWIHSALKKRLRAGKTPVPQWLTDYCDNAPKYPFPFGLQLLSESDGKPVAIVEAAKTAVIMTAIEPAALWLAVGSLSNLNAQRLEPIRGREIILYPDAGPRAFREWKTKAAKLRAQGFTVVCSDLLETYATEAEHADGYDLADYFGRDPEPIPADGPPVSEQKQEAPSSPPLPAGWIRNDKGELCDGAGLTVLDWWEHWDLEHATEAERDAVEFEFSNNGLQLSYIP